MIKGLFSIRDEEVAFGNLFSLPDNNKVAVRAFKDLIEDPRSGDVHKHPEDMVLYRIARFDDQSGEITPCREVIVRASDLDSYNGAL